MNTMQNQNSKPSATPWLIAGAVALLMAVVMIYLHDKRRNAAPAAAVVPAAAEAPAARPSTSSRYTPRRPIDGRAAAQAMAVRREEMAQKRKQVQARVDRTQAAFASRHRNETVDPGWSNAKEVALTKLATSDQIQQLGVDARNMAVDCRTSMCRITADFDSMAAGDDWVVLYMNNAAQQLPAASYKYIQHPDGTVTINVYAIGRR
jgi:hypothetical protein